MHYSCHTSIIVLEYEAILSSITRKECLCYRKKQWTLLSVTGSDFWKWFALSKYMGSVCNLSLFGLSQLTVSEPAHKSEWIFHKVKFILSRSFWDQNELLAISNNKVTANLKFGCRPDNAQVFPLPTCITCALSSE